MNILLISPLDPEKPTKYKFLMGGENTYTRLLLKHPPKDISFVHIDEAIEKGLVKINFLQDILLWLQKIRILPPGPRAFVFTLKAHFDLVYAHGYPVKIFSTKIPLVISDSSSNEVFLKYYLRAPKVIIKFWHFTKQIIFQLFQIIDGEVGTHSASGFFVFSKWAKKIKNQEFGAKNVEVIYPGLPVHKIKETSRLRSKNKNIKLLFVGVWFERKGGLILLSVFRKLVKKYPNISLTIVGEIPPDISINPEEKILQRNFVSYQELRKYYETHDILIHVPPVIEGYGMTVPEAMGFGMVPIVSNICALPEFVDHNQNGLVVAAGSQVELERALIKLIKNPRLIKNLGHAARQKFLTSFALPKFHKKLSALFHKALRETL